MKPKLSDIQTVSDGVGFVLYDSKGLPCATFSYPDQTAAEDAAEDITEALTNVKSITGSR
jgi:hypothetical protein